MDNYSKRKYLIGAIFILVALVFSVRLFRLQVVNNDYKQYATRNVLRRVVTYPARGLIYDRNGDLLVYNKASYDLLVTPREVSAFDTVFMSLCKDFWQILGPGTAPGALQRDQTWPGSSKPIFPGDPSPPRGAAWNTGRPEGGLPGASRGLRGRQRSILGSILGSIFGALFGPLWRPNSGTSLGSFRGPAHFGSFFWIKIVQK